MRVSGSVIRQAVAEVINKNYCKSPIRFLIYNNFDPIAGNLLLFIFSEGEKHPGIVIKISKIGENIKNEYENQRDLWKKLHFFIPEPLLFREIDSCGVIAMKVVRGNHLSRISMNSDLLSSLVDKMIFFHKKVQKGKIAPALLHSQINNTLKSIEHKNSNDQLVSFFSETLKQLHRKLKFKGIPRIPQHGDFLVNNILHNFDEICILDWEDFGRINIPGYDLYCLLLDLFGDKNFLDNRYSPGVKKMKIAIRDNIFKYFSYFSLSSELSRLVFITTILKQFDYSFQAGRSSVQVLWDRLRDYAENTKRYDRLFVL